MRSPCRARGVGSALALLIVLSSAPAGAQKPGKSKHRTSIASCASFRQADSGDATVDFTVTNSCPIELECTVTWSVTCAPDSKRKSKKFEGSSFTLTTMDQRKTTATAARCGDDGWAIADVTWNCAPAKKPARTPSN